MREAKWYGGNRRHAVKESWPEEFLSRKLGFGTVADIARDLFVVLIDVGPFFEPVGIPSMPHAFAFVVAVLTFDRLGAVGIPARMHPVLHAIGVVVD